METSSGNTPPPSPGTDVQVYTGAPPSYIVEATQGPDGAWGDSNLPPLPAASMRPELPAGSTVLEGTLVDPVTENAAVPVTEAASVGQPSAPEARSRWEIVVETAQTAGRAALRGADVAGRAARRLEAAKVFDVVDNWAAGRAGRTATVAQVGARVGRGLAEAHRGIVDEKPKTEVDKAGVSGVDTTTPGETAVAAAPVAGDTEEAKASGLAAAGAEGAAAKDLAARPPETAEGDLTPPPPPPRPPRVIGTAKVPPRPPRRVAATLPHEMPALRPDMTRRGPDGQYYYLTPDGGEHLLDEILRRGTIPLEQAVKEAKERGETPPTQSDMAQRRKAAVEAAGILRNLQIQRTDYATPMAAVHHGDGRGYNLAPGAASNVDPSTGKGATYRSGGAPGEADLAEGTRMGVALGPDGQPLRQRYARDNRYDFAVGPDGQPVRAARKGFLKGVRGILKRRRDQEQARVEVTVPEMVGAAVRDGFGETFTPTGRRWAREARDQAGGRTGNMRDPRKATIESIGDPVLRAAAQRGYKVSSDASTRGAWSPEVTQARRPRWWRRAFRGAQQSVRRGTSRYTG